MTYVSATIAPWSTKYVTNERGRITKQSMREGLRQHGNKVEFHLVSTPVTRGGLASIPEAHAAGIDEITVRTPDHRDIIVVIDVRATSVARAGEYVIR